MSGAPIIPAGTHIITLSRFGADVLHRGLVMSGSALDAG